MSEVLLFIEQRGGRIHPASLQLFTVANAIVGSRDSSIDAVVIGDTSREVVNANRGMPANRIFCVESADLASYNPAAFARAVSKVAAQTGARTLLFAATSMGRDLSPRVAARIGAALASDCTEISREEDSLRVRRSLFSGKLVGEFRLEGAAMVVTIRPNAFASPSQSGGTSEIVSVSFEVNDAERRLRTTDFVRAGGAMKDVSEADIIVSGGRSLKSEANFAILEDLARVLDAAVGASRAAVDAGYQPHARQVGLTGKTVTPRLYIACGIDGAIQHLAGMRGSKVIVAINTNPSAPIFQVATFGCVADLFELVPALTREFAKLKGTA